MSYVVKPAAAPGCWGAKFQDGDSECEQCKYKDTCRAEVLNRVVNPQAQRANLPVLRNYSPSVPVHSPPSPPTINFQRTQSAMVPLPAQPYYPPPVNALPTPQRPSAPQATTQQHVTPQTQQGQAQQYYQSSTGWSLPSNTNPSPMAPMFRPGAPSPAYYFTQYPGESVAGRIGKNILLRAAEAIFGELMQFFRHWTWPPR